MLKMLTLDDLLTRLGGVSLDRIRLDPPPGKATARDVVRVYEKERRLFELVDGTLVEKTMGAKESIIAFHIGYLLYQYMEAAGVSGVAMGEAGALRLLKGLVRIPDLSLFLEKNLPGGKMSEEPITPLAPDLAIEVLSRSNTRREMERKLKDYFLFGIKLVWYVDPVRRVVRVFTSPEDVKELGKNEILDGGEVLPGFRLPVSRFFEKLETLPASKAKPKRNRPR